MRRGLLPLPRRKALSEADLEALAETMNRPEHRTAPHYRAGSLPPSVPPSHRGEKAGVGPGAATVPSLPRRERPLVGGAAWGPDLNTVDCQSREDPAILAADGPRHFPPL